MLAKTAVAAQDRLAPFEKRAIGFHDIMEYLKDLPLTAQTGLAGAGIGGLYGGLTAATGDDEDASVGGSALTGALGGGLLGLGGGAIAEHGPGLWEDMQAEGLPETPEGENPFVESPKMQQDMEAWVDNGMPKEIPPGATPASVKQWVNSPGFSGFVNPPSTGGSPPSDVPPALTMGPLSHQMPVDPPKAEMPDGDRLKSLGMSPNNFDALQERYQGASDKKFYEGSEDVGVPNPLGGKDIDPVTAGLGAAAVGGATPALWWQNKHRFGARPSGKNIVAGAEALKDTEAGGKLHNRFTSGETTAREALRAAKNESRIPRKFYGTDKKIPFSGVTGTKPPAWKSLMAFGEKGKSVGFKPFKPGRFAASAVLPGLATWAYGRGRKNMFLENKK